jgi:hypothetical protein
VEVIWKGGARRGRDAGCGGCGEPFDGITVAMILLGCGLSCRTGMSRNSSDRRPVGPAGRVVVNVGIVLEGWRARIGGTGTGGVGNSMEDLLRGGASSSSKTVSCVIALTGRKGMLSCVGLLAGICWRGTASGAFLFTGLLSSSALIATPICESGRDESDELFPVPTPRRCGGRAVFGWVFGLRVLCTAVGGIIGNWLDGSGRSSIGT